MERRFKNMEVAFTYGKKLRYEDLDDPLYQKNIAMEQRARASNKDHEAKL